MFSLFTYQQELCPRSIGADLDASQRELTIVNMKAGTSFLQCVVTSYYVSSSNDHSREVISA
ncbi:hypothetical protein FIO92_21130 [Salmonella enterica]|nr:hypothetical protein [Salmonella enterica]EGV4823827.1 hypothetical protein [Salmonella enterica]